VKTTKYTEEELEIVDYIENTNPKSVPNLKEEMELITNIVSENVQKKKQVNFRLLESDLEKLKTRALIEGILQLQEKITGKRFPFPQNKMPKGA